MFTIIVLMLVGLFYHGVFGFHGGMRCFTSHLMEGSQASRSRGRSVLMMAKEASDLENQSSEAFKTRVEGIFGEIQHIWETG